MATKDEVNGFLAQFHTKAKVFGITYFGGREKNMNTLAELGITAKFRDDIVKQLSTEDFYKGPEPNVQNNLGDMWVFGKTINSKDVYIKITLGLTNAALSVCFSTLPNNSFTDAANCSI
jgi:hypothetical protein